MLKLVLQFVDATFPSLTDRMIARAFSRPRRKAMRQHQGEGPLRLVCAHDENPSGCAVWAAGTGPTVLLVHGWESTHRDLDPIARLLLDNRFRVVALDLPAHGASPGSMATIPELSRAVGRLVDWSQTSPIEAVIAHSLGGAASLRAISERKDQVPLALIASPSRARDYLQRMIAGFGLAPERIDRILKHYWDAHGVDIEIIDAELDGPQFRAPLLLLYGENDRLVPPSEGKRYASIIKHAELQLLPGLGHRSILIDRTVSSALLEFAKRATAAAAVA